MENKPFKFKDMDFLSWYEITSFMPKFDTYFSDQYIKMFVCKDTKNNWIAGIVKDRDIEYEEAIGTFLIERCDVPPEIHSIMGMLKHWQEDGSCWDGYETESLMAAYDTLDGTFGIYFEDSNEQEEYNKWLEEHS